MKRLVFLVGILLLGCTSVRAADTLRIATYNIQYPAAEPSWRAKRLPAIKQLLKDWPFDVFGSQEPFLPQLEDMMDAIGDRYAWVGDCTSGNNKDRKTHFNPIFYRKDRLKLLDHGVIWFYGEPGIKKWDSDAPRMCVWAKFKDKKSGKVFYEFNCHFDHKGKNARIESAKMLIPEIQRICAGKPFFVNGDFNCFEDSKPYTLLQNSGIMSDAMTAVPAPVNAEYYSMSHYKPLDTVPKHGKHLDHIFVSTGTTVCSWTMILDHQKGNFGSDHFPIMVEWIIQ